MPQFNCHEIYKFSSGSVYGDTKFLTCHSVLLWSVSLISTCIFIHRFDAHIMFSLARGKVSESTARLALAKEMMKVNNS